MRKTLFALSLLICIFLLPSSDIHAQAFQVTKQDVFEGFVVKRIPLSHYGVPQVTLSNVTYTNNVFLPKDAKPGDPNKYTVSIGMERKQPFAVVRIPAFVKASSSGQVNQVSNFTLTVTEPALKTHNAAARTSADVAVSVLSSGKWYKIGVTRTGFYKIDNSVLTTMGVSGQDISNIRVYGNGGRMLSEDNAVPRPVDLVENAIWINGGAAVFYASGPTGWNANTTTKTFTHVKNLYTDTAYYFVTFDKGPGLRIQGQPSISDANVNVSTYDYYDVHDTDMVNPAGLGKLWFGEQFNPQGGNLKQFFSFNAGTTISNLNCTVSFGCTSDAIHSAFTASVNGQDIGTSYFNSATPAGSDNVMTLNTAGWPGTANTQNLNIGITFTPADASSIGYLNYIEINGRGTLAISGDQVNFRDWQSVGTGNIASYQLQGANNNTRVWDVTNPQVPVMMNGTISGTVYSFNQDAQALHEFAAMNSMNLYTPSFAGQVKTQNLHGMSQADLLIVTYPDFSTQAERLAVYHRTHDNMRVNVVTTDEVYNEFSSGGQDLSAIRDFTRMFYKRAGNDVTQMPKYLLLFGGASYDYKNRLANNSNFVPVFESTESLNDLNSFSSDDFYGFLDDSEYIESQTVINVLDIGIGRLPARSVDDATSLVDKIIGYTSAATLGPWRTSATFAACRNDNAGTHMLDAESMAGIVSDTTWNLYNVGKVYEDAISLISTPAGARCPAANQTINNAIYKGTLMINYNGHGNTAVLSSERILTEDDYNNWNNPNMLPFLVTATCDYGQFDHPQFVSAAEHMVIRSGGGAIAMLTTTQAVFAVFNHPLNAQYLGAQFYRNADGSWNTFGDACRIGKNLTFVSATDLGEIANYRKFALLGDPALTPDFPRYKVNLDSVIDGVTMQVADTIKALGKYILNGSVRDNNGNILRDFNGTVYVTFYDKPRNITTITDPPLNFTLQDNIVYKGKVSVTNGQYKLTFITPKDINYFYGSGKVSTYAENGNTDGAGVDTRIAIGGFSDNPQLSSAPPVVRPYINDSLFLNGGITGNNTSLFVSLYSETGINVSGNNIGHDLTAVLDGNVEVPYILNDYYETAPNTYQRGFVNFPIQGLANGRHTITVKAWDVNDNSGTGTVDFVVVDGQVMDIKNLANYPNPFNNTTTFVFEHNHPDELLQTELRIYSISGTMVRTIKRNITPAGSRTNEITWDGTDNNGTRLPSGVYVYRLNISTEKGFKSSAYQKLVIVR